MMKQNRVIRIAAMLLLVLPTLSNAADNLKFSGALVAEPCVIPPGQEMITLDFGSVVDKYLYLNQRTPGAAFALTLADCDLSLGKGVRITLRGTESRSLPGLLAPVSQAGGVAIGLETPEGQAISINRPGEKFSLEGGSNVIRFQAYVRGEPEAIANKTIGRGAFSAVATFSLEYE